LELRDIFIVPLTRRQLFRAGLDSPLNFSTASRIAPSSTIAEASGHCPSGGRRSSFGTDCTTRAHPGSGWLYIRRLARTPGTTPGAAGALPRLAEALKLLAVADPQDLTSFAGPLVPVPAGPHAVRHERRNTTALGFSGSRIQPSSSSSKSTRWIGVQ